MSHRIALKRSWAEHSALWLAVVARSGEHKSPALYAALRPVYDREKNAADEHEAAREQYEVTSRQLRAGYTKVRDDVGTVVDDVTDYTRENPGRAILIAAAAGFIVGLLFRPRRRYSD